MVAKGDRVHGDSGMPWCMGLEGQSVICCLGCM